MTTQRLFLLQRLSRNGGCNKIIKSSNSDPSSIISQTVDSQGMPIPKPFSIPWISTLRHRMVSVFLPDGYPVTVHPNYSSFTIWNFAHMTLSSTVGVLSTQSLLYGLGLANGATALSLSATLNWILKDGIGQLGGIAIVSRLGSRFDVDAKRFRFIAAIFLHISCLFELFVPMWPKYFILTAAAANVLKNIAWMSTSATRAQIHRHFALKDNMGDVTGKTASQNTLASTFGTAFGAGLSSYYLQGAHLVLPFDNVMTCVTLFAPLSLASLYAAYKSCQYAVSPRLTPARLKIVFDNLFQELFGKNLILRKEILIEASRYVMTPEIVSDRESFVFPEFKEKSKVTIMFDPEIGKSTDLEIFDDPSDHYWIKVEENPEEIRIWFKEGIEKNEIFQGIIEVYILEYFINQNITICGEESRKIAGQLLIPLINAFTVRNWDMEDFSCLNQRPISFPITESKED